jgi:hypothetical protein
MKTNNIELNSLASKIGAENNLLLTSRETMKRLALGLDEEKRKLLVVQKTAEDQYDWRIVSIDNIKDQFIKKTYRNLETADLNKGILDEYLEKVTLFIAFLNCRQPFEITFYDHNDHTVFELTHLIQIARDWHVTLSQISMRQTYYNSAFLNYKSNFWQGY